MKHGTTKSEASRAARGRELYANRAWRGAYTEFASADNETPLGPHDLELFAAAAFLIGRDAETVDALSRAHNEFLKRGNVEDAARCAFWLGFRMVLAGESARGSGWLQRARRLLDDGAVEECVVHGYLLLPAAIRTAVHGDLDGAFSMFSQALEIGERFKDRDLVILGRHGQGRVLLRMGRIDDGGALFDEIMVAVTADEASPTVVGGVFCSVLTACNDVFDLRRAQEWADVLHEWCASQPDLVPHRGECYVRHAELVRFHGGWSDAMDLVSRACECLTDPPNQPAAGAAFYQQGELYRLRGEFAEAEESYRTANQHGRRSQPGLALLRLAQGRIDDAVAAIKQTLTEVSDRAPRSIALMATIEIMLAAADVAHARAASDELSQIALALPVPFLQAAAAHGLGAVRRAEGDARGAIASLREAWSAWHALAAPYEAARARMLIALAHRELGDRDLSAMELDAARHVFESLGATTDLARVAELSAARAKRADALTDREVQVLQLLATGKTNRAMATELGISEKTVARHVSNIFLKLDLSTRAAATAYVFQNDLAGVASRST